MKLHATLRRTLALLLVLIFAMSNIGLAEVAEQLTQYEDDPVIFEEEYVEAEAEAGEPEEAPEDAAEPEGDAAAEGPEEDQGDEAQAPDVEEAEVVDATEAATAISVEVQKIDDTSLCAYESIEPEGIYDVTFQWERATDAEGEWEALEADGDVYSTDAEDRFDYVYRCTVTAGGLSATSEPVAYAEAEEEPHAIALDLGDDFGLAEVNAGELQFEIASSKNNQGIVWKNGDEYVVVAAGEAGENTYSFELTVKDASGDALDESYNKLTFVVAKTENAEADESGWSIDAIKGGFTGTAENLAATITGATVDQGVTAYVKVTADNNESSKGAEVKTGVFKLYVLPKLENVTTYAKPAAAGQNHFETPDGESDNDTKIGEEEHFKVGFETADNKAPDAKYGLGVQIVKKGESKASDLFRQINEGFVYDITKKKIDAKTDVQFDVQLTTSVKDLETTVTTLNSTNGDNAGKYCILPRPEKLEKGSASLRDTIAIYLKGDTGSDNTDLTLALNAAGTEPNQSEAEVWLGDVAWSVVGTSNQASSGGGEYVHFGGAGTAATITGADQHAAKLHIKAVKATPTGQPVEIQVKGRVWNAAKTALEAEKTLTWKIEVLDSDAAKDIAALTDDDFVVTALKYTDATKKTGAIVGQPDGEVKAGEEPAWATVSFALSDAGAKKVGDFPVTFSVEANQSLEQLKDAKGQAVPGTFIAVDKLIKADTSVTVTATVNTGKSDKNKTHTFTVHVRPIANKWELTLEDKSYNKILTNAATSAATAIDVRTGRKYTVNATLKRDSVKDEAANLYGEIDHVYFQRKPADAKPGDRTPDSNGSWTFGTGASNTGLYEITVDTSVGTLTNKYYVKALDLPGRVEVKADRAVVYAGTQAADTVNLSLVYYDTDGRVVKDGEGLYIKNLAWKLVSYDDDVASLIEETGTTEDPGANSGKIWVNTSSNKAVLTINKASSSVNENIINKTFDVYTMIEDKEFQESDDLKTFTIKKEVAAGDVTKWVSSFNAQWTFAPNPETEEDTGTKYLVAQGTDVTSSLDTTKGTQADIDKLKGYTLLYKVEDTAESKKLEGEDLANWITIDAQGNISVKAEGTKNKLALDFSKKEQDYHDFKVTAYIEGIAAAKVDRTIRVVSAPVAVEITDESGDPLPPVITPYDETPVLKAKAVGPEIVNPNDKSDSRPAKSTGKITNITAATGATIEPVDKDHPETNNTWKFTKVNTDGTTITFKTEGINVPNDDKIRVVNVYNVVDAKYKQTTCQSGGNHQWKTDAQTKSGKTAEGHTFVCASCGERSVPVAHGDFFELTPAADGTVELWRSDDGDNKGEVKCLICGYECTHVTDPLDTSVEYTWHNGYHTYTCPVCGEEVRGKHVDDRQPWDQCDYCANVNVTATFSDTVGVVVAGSGVNYTPNLTIAGPTNAQVEFSIEQSDNYVEFVDPIDGKQMGTIKGLKGTPIDPKKPEETGVKLIATITVDPDSDAPYIFTKELPIEVKSFVKNIEIKASRPNTDDKADTYLIDDGNVVELTVDTGDLVNPDLRQYAWSSDKKGSSNIQYVKYDAATETYTEIERPDPLPTDAQNDKAPFTKVIIKLEQPPNALATKDVVETLSYGPTNEAKDGQKATIKVATLPQLANASKPAASGGTLHENTTEIKPAISFDDDDGSSSTAINLIQGGTAKVALQTVSSSGRTKTITPFDERYGSVAKGTVRFTVAGKSGDSITGELNAAQVADWITVSDDGTITAKKAGADNVLTGTQSATFVITATITLDELDKDSNNKPVHKIAYGTRDIKVVPKPASVDAYLAIATAEPSARSDAKFQKYAAPLSVMEGDEVYIYASDTNDTSAVLKDDAVKFTFPAGAFEEVDEAAAKGKEVEFVTTKKFYALTVKDGAPKTITISGTYSGNSIPDVVLNVTEKIDKITVSPDLPNGAAVGEKKVVGGGTEPLSIVLTADPSPASSDTFTWSYQWVTDSELPKDGSKPTGLDTATQNIDSWIQKDAKDSTKLTINIGDTLDTEHTMLLVEATAVKSKEVDEDGKVTGTPVSGWTVVHLYKTPSGSEGLLLTTARSVPSGNFSLTAGERVEFTEHGYDTAKGYGSSAGKYLTPEVVSATDASGATVNANTVARIETDGDKAYLVGVGPGKAMVKIETECFASGKNASKQIEVTVGNAVNAVEIDKTATGLEKPNEVQELYEGKTQEAGRLNHITIADAALSAWRPVQGSSTGQRERATEAVVELKASDPNLVEIKKSGTSWTVTAKKDGEGYLYACVGDVQNDPSQNIPFKVYKAPETVDFYYTDTNAPVTGQIQVEPGDTTPIKLTAKVGPANAYGTPVIEPESSEAFGTSVTQNTVEITPKADKTGTVVIYAKVKNPKYDETAGVDKYMNNEYLTGHVEIVIPSETGEEPGPGPDIEVDTAVKTVYKSAIGPNETTTLKAIGVTDGANIQWKVKEGSVGAVSLSISDDKFTATVTGGDTPGKVTIEATDGATIIGTADIDVLSAISNVSLGISSLAANESITLIPKFEGYSASGVVPDLRNLFKMTSSNNSYLKVSSNEDGVSFTLTGVKGGTKASKKTTVTITTYDGKATVVNLPILGKNTSFSIGNFADSTVVMKSTDTKEIPLTFKSASATINLDWNIEGAGDGSIKVEGKNLITKDAGTGTYPVEVSAPGYPERPHQYFTIEVTDEEATDAATIAFDKIGVANAYENVNVANGITIVRGEVLQAKLVDESGTALSGVTWTQAPSSKSKAKLTIDADTGIITTKRNGTATLTAAAGSVTKTVSVKVVSAPTKSKVKLDPNATARKVAFGEPFKLALGPDTLYAYDGKWQKTIQWSANVGADGELSVAYDDTTKTYEFSSDDETKTYTASATLATSWGVSKTVTFTVGGEYAESLALKQEIKLPVTGTTIVTPEGFDEGAYAELQWTVNDSDIAVGKTKKLDSTRIVAKVLDNSTLQITTKKAVAGTAVSIKVKAVGDPTNEASATATITANSTAFPADAQIVFTAASGIAKNTIGVKEKITASVVSETEDVIGKVTFTAKSADGKGKATVSGSTLTGSKPGLVTVTAKIGSDTKTANLLVLPKATYTYSQKPTTMMVGETLTVDVTIGGYDVGQTIGEDYTVDTSNLLQITNKNPDMIVTNVAPADSEDEQPVHKYSVTLKAVAAKLSSKNAYTSASVVIAPQTGAAKQTMKIKVVGGVDDEEEITEDDIVFPENVYIGQGETISLPAATIKGTTNVVNLNWSFEDPAAATANGLSFKTNGKLFAGKAGSSTVGSKTQIIGSTILGEGNEITIEATVNIGAKVSNKNQFSVELKKSTVGVGEPAQAIVKFSEPVTNASGKVTWKSSASKYASIDKTTGVITAKAFAAKTGKGATKITATVNGKKSTAQTLTVVAAPTDIKFNVSDLKVQTGTTYTLYDKVTMTGGAKATKPENETAFTFSFENDADSTQKILQDVDPVTGELTFNSGVTAGTAHVTVTTYNGHSDDLLIVMGNGASEGGDKPPVTVDAAADVEIWINGIKLGGTTDSNKMTVKEGDKIYPVVVVKNAKSEDITAQKADSIQWADDGTGHVTIDKAAGSITAVKTTTGVAGNPPTAITVSADDQTSMFYLNIQPVISGAHIGLFTDAAGAKPVPGLMVKSTTSAKLQFGVDKTVSTLKNANWTMIRITNKTPDKIEFTGTLSTGSDGEMKQTANNTVITVQAKPNAASDVTLSNLELKANGVGTAEILVEAKYGSDTVVDGVTKEAPVFENTITINIDDLPTLDQIEVTSEDFEPNSDKMKLVLGKGEPATIEVKLPASYGTAKDWEDSKVLEVKAVPFAKGADGKDQPTYATKQEKYIEGIAAKTGDTSKKYTVKLDENETLTEGKYRIVITAFKDEKLTKEIEVEIKNQVAKTWDADDLEIKSTPEIISANTILTGNGEPVKLQVLQKETSTKYWKHGFEWKIKTPNSGTTKATLENGPDGTATVKFSDAKETNTQTVVVQVVRKGFGENDTTDGPMTGKDITIKFVPKPTDKTGASIKVAYKVKDTAQSYATVTDPAQAIVFGEGEKISATVDFANGVSTDSYTNDVHWETKATCVSIEENGRTATITGLANANPKAEFTMDAYTMNGTEKVVLGTFTFQVKNKPAKLELKNETANAVFDGYMAASDNLTLTMNFGEDEYGTYQLTSSDAKIKVTETGRNKWTVAADSGAFNVGTEVYTLILRSVDQDKITRISVQKKAS